MSVFLFSANIKTDVSREVVSAILKKFEAAHSYDIDLGRRLIRMQSADQQEPEELKKQLTDAGIQCSYLHNL